MPQSPSPLPLASIIGAAVALDDALLQERFPLARHEARVIALRADKGGFSEIAARARTVMTVLGEAIRPVPGAWEPPVAQLHAAIDQALDADVSPLD